MKQFIDLSQKREWKYFLPILLLLVSCHVNVKEFSGIYEGADGNQIEISCDRKFSTSESLYMSGIPQNGEKVTVVPNEETYDVCYTYNGVMTSFGKWDPDNKEFFIRGIRYKLIKKSECE